MSRSVKLTGFSDLHRALGDMKKATANNVLRRAGMEALEPVVEVMTAEAPELSGELKGAYAVGTKRSKRAKKHFKGSKVVEIYAGVAVAGGGMPPQATQQEFGNENHGPQPAVRPAWDQEGDATLDRLKESLGGEIEKAAERAARKSGKGR